MTSTTPTPPPALSLRALARTQADTTPAPALPGTHWVAGTARRAGRIETPAPGTTDRARTLRGYIIH